MSESKTETVAIVVAIASIVISLASLGFSIFVYRSSRLESLSVEASLARGGGVIRCRDFGGAAGVLQTPVEVVLSNTGDRTLSVTRYEIFEISGSGGRIQYTHLDGGLVASEGTPLPIILGAGESQQVFLWLGLRPVAEARSIIVTERLCEQALSRRLLQLVLGRQSMDLYGNKVELVEYGEAYNLSGPDITADRQRFILVVETGRGSRFAATTSWYPFEEYFD